MEQAAIALGRCSIYEIIKDENGQTVCNTRYVENYEPARDHTQEFIDGLSRLSDREKAEKLVWYVCDQMTYEVKYPGPGKVLSQDGVVSGCCMAYSHAFQFLRDRVGILCVLVCNDIHMWNQVYLDGQWWLVDVTASDAGNETAHRESSNYTPFYDIDTYWGASTVDGYPENRLRQGIIGPRLHEVIRLTKNSFRGANDNFLITLPRPGCLTGRGVVLCLAEKGAHTMLNYMRELQKRFTHIPGHTEELAKIEKIFNELKPKLECGGARLRCLLDIEKKLRKETAEENFTAGFALGWEIRKELQDAGVFSINNGEDPGTIISGEE